MLPLHDDNPVQRPAVITWLVIAACVAVYFLWQPDPFADSTADAQFNVEHAAVPCEVVQGRPLDVNETIATYQQGNSEACNVDDGASAPYVPGKNVWLAVLASMFLHGSLLHLGGNMLFLWVFGNNIEDVLGRIGFTLFYAAGGIIATFGHILANRDSTVPVVGASGAIAAVMGAYLVLFPNAKVHTAVFMILITVVRLPAKWVLGFWFVLQFFTNPNEGVAWVAHVAGFSFGVVVGLLARSLRGPQVPAGYPPPAGPWAPRPGGWG